MKNKNARTKKPAIIPSDQDVLARFVPDLDSWPAAWRIEDDDLSVGQAIVQYLRPYLLDLLHQSITDKTRRRHRDHLCMLGGELIRRRQEDPVRSRRPASMLLENYLEEEGGPLIWPHISEAQQNAFDATCRKLYRFLYAT